MDGFVSDYINTPDPIARPVPPPHETLVPLDAPLGSHAKALFAAVLALGTELDTPTPPINLDTATGAQALDATHELPPRPLPADETLSPEAQAGTVRGLGGRRKTAWAGSRFRATVLGDTAFGDFAHVVPQPR